VVAIVPASEVPELRAVAGDDRLPADERAVRAGREGPRATLRSAHWMCSAHSTAVRCPMRAYRSGADDNELRGEVLVEPAFACPVD